MLGEERGLYYLSVSGGEPKLIVKITDVGLGVKAQWSPIGNTLAYAAGKSIYVIDAAGSKPREIAHLERGWEDNTLRWSPDGKFIAAFCRDMDKTPTPGPQNAVFVVPASGGEPRQLTPDIEYKQRLEWHPDGTRITYHVSRYNSETRQAYLDGRPPSLLLDAPDVWDYEGTWAPDGRRFFFLAGHGSEPEGLYVYDEASGKTTFVGDCFHIDEESVPSWSRDGKTMAWTATRTTARQTWIMENFLPESTNGK
jgi:Tol biopolymer transport system component